MNAFASNIALGEASRWTAGKLAARLPTVPSSATCGEVFDWLEVHGQQPAVAILDDEGRVQGLVNRVFFLATYARRYYPELYGKRSILALANTRPLIADEHIGVGELGAMMVLDNPAALVECFIVTSQGRYFGIGTGEALMRSKVALLQLRQHELNDALAEAREASRTKSNFLALMSHELRTPLNAIIGFSEILQGEIFGPMGNEKYREYSGDIHDAGKHLLTLINDILDLSKAEAGKLDLRLESVSLGAVIADCEKLVAGRAHDNGLKLDIRLDEDLPGLLADETRLKQILLNLLSNAVKFTPAGGRIEIRAARDEKNRITLSVSDTGIGMSPEMIPVALEPFRQIASPHNRNVEGTGLGLSLVKSLTTLHDAELEIESALDRGTKVSVHFPSSRSTPQDSALTAC